MHEENCFEESEQEAQRSLTGRGADGLSIVASFPHINHDLQTKLPNHLSQKSHDSE